MRVCVPSYFNPSNPRYFILFFSLIHTPFFFFWEILILKLEVFKKSKNTSTDPFRYFFSHLEKRPLVPG